MRGRGRRKYMSKLKQLREERGLLQKAVAKSVGITTSYYGMIELGTRRPGLDLAIRICKYFDLSVEEVFE